MGLSKVDLRLDGLAFPTSCHAFIVLSRTREGKRGSSGPPRPPVALLDGGVA